MLSPAAIRSLALTLVLAPALSAQPLDQNLLLNPSFEDLLDGWSVISSVAATVSYGEGEVAGTFVSDHIGGGGRLLRDGDGAIVEQIVPLPAIPEGSNLHAGGYFGGWQGIADDARLVLRFLDGAGVEIQRHDLPWVTNQRRNFETVLVRREGLFAIPAETASVAARVEFRNVCCGEVTGTADALFVELVDTPLIPPAVPMDTELVVNPGFESGWGPFSPLSANDQDGWQGFGDNQTRIVPYDDDDNMVPGVFVACLVEGGEPGTSCDFGGAGNLAQDFGGNTALHQRIDVRGNAAQFAGPEPVALAVSAYLGGMTNIGDDALVDVKFLDAQLTPISALPTLGPVKPAMRNLETVIVRRALEYLVPPATCYIDVVVAFGNVCCGEAAGLVDNVSVKLVQPTAQVVHTLDSNLVRNGSFESGSLSGSPLQLNDPSSWEGVSTHTGVVSYGSSATVPSPDFAAGNGLDGLLLVDKGAGILHQTIDMRGHAEDIAAGTLELRAEAWVGGHGTIEDTAEVRIRFLNAFDVQLGTMKILGPVTAADRGLATTLLKRKGTYDVPQGTESIDVAVHFTDVCCGSQTGLADGIDLRLREKSGPGGGINGDALCHAPRILATAVLSKKVLGCHAKAAKQPTTSADVLAACLDKLAGKYGIKFDKAVSKAQKKGAVCAPSATADTMAGLVLEDGVALAASIEAGVDSTDKLDLGLRSKLLKLTAGHSQKWLKAVAKDLKKPVPSKLQATQAKLHAAFLKKSAKLVASAVKKGIEYDGQPADELVTDIETRADTLVEKLLEPVPVK